MASTQRIADAATFDELACVFGDVLQWTEGNKTISVEFGKVLRAIQERLANHLTIVRGMLTEILKMEILILSGGPHLDVALAEPVFSRYAITLGGAMHLVSSQRTSNSVSPVIRIQPLRSAQSSG